jgi:small conductance mechanosensitive channel
MLGVDALTDSAVTIKLLVRTLPLSQWTVKRELLRRIKNRFDELGIEIPYPHRTVYHRGLDGLPSTRVSEAADELTDQSGKGGGGCFQRQTDPPQSTKLHELDSEASLSNDQ